MVLFRKPAIRPCRSIWTMTRLPKKVKIRINVGLGIRYHVPTYLTVYFFIIQKRRRPYPPNPVIRKSRHQFPTMLLHTSCQQPPKSHHRTCLRLARHRLIRLRHKTNAVPRQSTKFQCPLNRNRSRWKRSCRR